MPKKSSNKAKSQRSREQALLQKVHLNAAGIDIGADTHWVAVPDVKDCQWLQQLHTFGMHLFELQTALDLYDVYQRKILECEAQVEQHLQQWETKVDFEQALAQTGALQTRSASVRLELHRQAQLVSVCGVDLTRVPGLSTLAVRTIIGETGLDMNCWKSEKHFCSWLKLCPDNRISGGKVLSSRARRTRNRATAMFRLAAQSALRSQTAIGATGFVS